MKKYTTSQRLKQLMDERKIKQVDILIKAEPFCKKYGVKLNKNDLSQYVNGKVEPGQQKLSILGLALNVNEAWLMGYDVPMKPAISGAFYANKNLNGGLPYLSWMENDLVNNYVKKEQAKENVQVIPCFNIDDVHFASLNLMVCKPLDYRPLLSSEKPDKTYIYVICNTKYDDYRGNMYPLIEDNDILLVDFGAEPQNGDLTMIEFSPGKNFPCRYYKYDDYMEFQFISHKSIRVQNDDENFKRYDVRGIVKQVIKNIQ